MCFVTCLLVCIYCDPCQIILLHPYIDLPFFIAILGPISHQEDGMVLDESLHVEVNNDYHCAKWIKSDLEASDNLRCRVSNDVSVCTYMLVAFTCKVTLSLQLQRMIGLF